MKKTYKNPTLKVVNVKPAQFIAVSQADMYGTNATSAGMSRGSRYSSWEEDDAAVEE